METTGRAMPEALDLGRHVGASLNFAMVHYSDWIERGRPADQLGRRMVMGFVLPDFQRPAVWTRDQEKALIRSLWMGIPIGTFSYTELADAQSPLNNLLIDGQQRMRAIEGYLNDGFEVFGYRWSEIPDDEKRSFKLTRKFGCFVVNNADEAFLRAYSDLMNFGGTAHTESQRAST